MPLAAEEQSKHEKKGLKWRSETPGSRKRALEITDHEWNLYREAIMRMHHNGLTRKEINASLLSSYGFRPTRAQLVRQLGKWGLSVYKERNQRKAAPDEQCPQLKRQQASSKAQALTLSSIPSAGSKFEDLLRQLESSRSTSSHSSSPSSPDNAYDDQPSIMLPPASPTFSMISFEEYAEEIRQNQSIPQVWMVLGTSRRKQNGVLQPLWPHILSWIAFLGWLCYRTKCRYR